MENVKKNIFLFIIWNNAYSQKDRILEDIHSAFHVLKTMEIQWSAENFNNNLNRFYGIKLPKNSFKEKACGTGPFTLVVYEDESPLYEDRKTTRGTMERVNIHSFDKKAMYRKWTTLPSGNNCLHGTNTPEETEHDLTLLTGMCPEDFIEKNEELPDFIEMDLVGAKQWNSFNELFYVLNHTCTYCMMRNFESVPDSFTQDGHDDIDLLAENYEEIQRICNAVPVFRYKYRVHNECLIDGKKVLFDFRFLGDGYYDKEWERKILDTRELFHGVYIPDSSNYPYMILYHALVQKRSIADNYTDILNRLFGQGKWNRELLVSFLKDNGYSFSEPADISVFYNEEVTGKKMSLPRKLKIFFRRVRRKLFNDRG